MNGLNHLVFGILITLPWKIQTWRPTINVAYHELSPYISRNKNGSVSGIIPEVLSELSSWCIADSKYTLNMVSANNFSNLLESRTKMKEYMEVN